MERDPGKRLKELGMRRALSHANPKWVKRVYWAISKFYQLRTKEFTADDMRELVEASGVKTENPSALGSIVASLAKDGIIEKVPGKQVVSRREETHNRPLTVWRFSTKDSSEERGKADYKFVEATTIRLFKRMRKEEYTEENIRSIVREACLLGIRWGRKGNVD